MERRLSNIVRHAELVSASLKLSDSTKPKAILKQVQDDKSLLSSVTTR